MTLSIRAAIFALFMLAALLTVPILIGVYVYRDAHRRGMNAALWTLIAVAAPALIGFIIYLLIRGNDPDLQCPSVPDPLRSNTLCVPIAEPNCARPVPTARFPWNRNGRCAPSAQLRSAGQRCAIPHPCGGRIGR